MCTAADAHAVHGVAARLRAGQGAPAVRGARPNERRNAGKACRWPAADSPDFVFVGLLASPELRQRGRSRAVPRVHGVPVRRMLRGAGARRSGVPRVRAPGVRALRRRTVRCQARHTRQCAARDALLRRAARLLRRAARLRVALTRRVRDTRGCAGAASRRAVRRRRAAAAARSWRAAQPRRRQQAQQQQQRWRAPAAAAASGAAAVAAALKEEEEEAAQRKPVGAVTRPPSARPRACAAAAAAARSPPPPPPPPAPSRPRSRPSRASRPPAALRSGGAEGDGTRTRSL
jgi:hypothetical protein